MSDDERWIVIPSWRRFQHYHDRDPIFIKNYLALLHDDDYLSLTGHQRAVLHGLWLAYASSHCQLRVNTSSLSRQLSLRVSTRTLEALNHAGFVDFSASKPLALARARERAREKASKEASKTRASASDRASANARALEAEDPPSATVSEQMRARQIYEPDEPERDPEALAKIRALAAGIGQPLLGRPDDNGADPDNPFRR